MRHFEVRESLISQTISVIAAVGLEGTTTRQISKATGINEAYIYRCFQDKDDLIAEAFFRVDTEILGQLADYAEAARGDFKTVLRMLWRYLLQNREKTLTFVRYFYSPYFQKHSAARHGALIADLAKGYAPRFLPGTNVELLLQYMICTQVSIADSVFKGCVPADAQTEEDVVRLVYQAVSPFFCGTVEERVTL